MPRNSTTIRQRADGRWEARATVGPEGARKRLSRYADTPDEARRKLTAALASDDAGVSPPSEKESCAAYLTDWLATKQPTLRPESYRRYADAVRLHLIPHLGRVRLARLTPTMIEACYGKLRAEGLSGTTVGLIHGTLRKALQDAVRKGELSRNVATLIDAPRRSTPEMRVLNREEADRFLAAAEGDELEALFVIAITLGPRLAELQGLRWRYVDLENRRLTIASQFDGNVDGKPTFAHPKTASSKRTIRIPALVVDALRRHRTAQLEERLRAGRLWVDNDLVFCNAVGGVLDGNNLRSRSFARLLERAGLPPMRFHALRHTAATLLMLQGVPAPVIMRQLGHSDIGTTLRVYSHVLDAMEDDAANAIDAMYSGLTPNRKGSELGSGKIEVSN